MLMKKAIVWAFLFVILVLLVAQAIDSNREEFSRAFPLKMSLPLIGVYQTEFELSVAAYLALAVIVGAGAVALLSLSAVVKAGLEMRRARRELAASRAELSSLRGPAEDDPVYQRPSTSTSD
jgi:hypothetical protein